MAPPKGTNAPNGGNGRPKGALNKNTKILKDAIIEAAELQGDGSREGLVEYLRTQARENPTSFNILLGKVLPLTLAGDKQSPLVLAITPEDTTLL